MAAMTWPLSMSLILALGWREKSNHSKMETVGLSAFEQSPMFFVAWRQVEHFINCTAFRSDRVHPDPLSVTGGRVEARSCHHALVGAPAVIVPDFYGLVTFFLFFADRADLFYRLAKPLPTAGGLKSIPRSIWGRMSK
jgi:hypothetical protein